MTRVFAGTYSHSLDGKGRVIIPAGFRDLLGSGFTIALNSSIDALALYPQEKWDAVNEQLSRVRDTFVGMRDHIELWDSAAFAEKARIARENFAALRRHVNETY